MDKNLYNLEIKSNPNTILNTDTMYISYGACFIKIFIYNSTDYCYGHYTGKIPTCITTVGTLRLIITNK